MGLFEGMVEVGLIEVVVYEVDAVVERYEEVEVGSIEVVERETEVVVDEATEVVVYEVDAVVEMDTEVVDAIEDVEEFIVFESLNDKEGAACLVA